MSIRHLDHMVRTLFKLQDEFSRGLPRLLDHNFRIPAEGRHHWELTTVQPDGTRVHAVSDTAEGLIHVKASHGALTYEARLPMTELRDITDLRVKVTQTAADGTVLEQVHLPLTEFVSPSNGTLPKALHKLHGVVADYMGQQFPKLSKLLQSPASTREPTPTDTDTSPADAPASAPAECNLPDNPVETTGTTAEAPDAWKDITVVREGMPNLRFRGRVLKAMQSTVVGGRWKLLVLFETESQKNYVAIEVGHSNWFGETSRSRSQVVSRQNGESTAQSEVRAFFGHSATAKALYAELGWDDLELVE